MDGWTITATNTDVIRDVLEILSGDAIKLSVVKRGRAAAGDADEVDAGDGQEDGEAKSQVSRSYSRA